jgi:hypothetical protein
MESEYIGSIQIFDDCSTIDLPNEMPNEVLEMLQKTVVCGKRLAVFLPALSILTIVERLCKEILNYRENLGFFPRLLLFSSSRLWFLENFLRPVVRFLLLGLFPLVVALLFFSVSSVIFRRLPQTTVFCNIFNTSLGISSGKSMVEQSSKI